MTSLMKARAYEILENKKNKAISTSSRRYLAKESRSFVLLFAKKEIDSDGNLKFFFNFDDQSK